MGEETVYVSTAKKGVTRSTYHTDEDCPHLQQADSYHEKVLEHLWDQFECCNWCQDGVSNPDNQGWGSTHYQSLVDAAEGRGEADD